jgi:hypothetical protein
MTLINFRAYALFRAGNDSVDIAKKLQISEPEAVKALVDGREENRRGGNQPTLPAVNEPSVESK